MVPTGLATCLAQSRCCRPHHGSGHGQTQRTCGHWAIMRSQWCAVSMLQTHYSRGAESGQHRGDLLHYLTQEPRIAPHAAVQAATRENLPLTDFSASPASLTIFHGYWLGVKRWIVSNLTPEYCIAVAFYFPAIHMDTQFIAPFLLQFSPFFSSLKFLMNSFSFRIHFPWRLNIVPFLGLGRRWS